MRWLAMVLLVGCGGEPVAVDPGDWGQARRTQQGRYRVAVDFQPADPPLGELFAARATVTTPDGEAVEDATVTLDALMPHHGHGMETSPKMARGDCEGDGERCRHPGGVYLARGFKFHMPGPWTVTVDVEGPSGLDNTSFVYEMK